MPSPPCPTGADIAQLGRGVAAGAVGTLAMTGWQELAAKLMSSGAPDGDGSAADRDPDPWEQAPVPAQVARRLGRLVGWDPPAERIGLLTNVMHYGYGTGWGVGYALTRERTEQAPALALGAAFGTAVWAASYVQLVPLGLYEPPWRYSPGELALDLSYHLVYGVATALALAGLERGVPRG